MARLGRPGRPGPARRFRTASIVKAEILAALLLRGQRLKPTRSGPALTGPQRELAVPMIEVSDDAAAGRLWETVGAGAGLAAANRALGLRHTIPGPSIYWGLTSTTAGDQLTLLRDLTGRGSPLNATSRAYELSLMRGVEPGQRWGVAAAASPGHVFAIKDGWLPDGSAESWVINSIGVLDHRGQRLLMAVLSDDQPTEPGGIALNEAAARAAAACGSR